VMPQGTRGAIRIARQTGRSAGHTRLWPAQAHAPTRQDRALKQAEWRPAARVSGSWSGQPPTVWPATRTAPRSLGGRVSDKSHVSRATAACVAQRRAWGRACRLRRPLRSAVSYVDEHAVARHSACLSPAKPGELHKCLWVAEACSTGRPRGRAGDRLAPTVADADRPVCPAMRTLRRVPTPTHRAAPSARRPRGTDCRACRFGTAG
jgi:hypothetical protein